MSSKATASRADGEDWFTALCAEHGLVPARPKFASDIEAGDVLFDVMGVPRPVIHVARGRRDVRIKHKEGPDTVWENNLSISLIARPKEATT